MDRRNIVLTGFMGTGKTSVGRMLARQLARVFVDMDARIEEREGETIVELFRDKGESYFRHCESTLCRELAAAENLVIATGGGTLVNPENRAAFAKAHVICLDASPEEIVRRLNGSRTRPLLQGDKRASVQRLLAAREAAYAAIAWHLPTGGRTPRELAEEIIAMLEHHEIPVRTPEGVYRIVLGNGLLSALGEFLAPGALAARAAVVTNPTVGAMYADTLCQALGRAGFEPVVLEIPEGEEHKNLDTVRTLYDQFIAARLERRPPVFALGGGVIGDTVGFAAATYLRGVPFVQVPTTLLAMVDSSIGGKVAVDHPAGKNLVGAFKFPLLVPADLKVLGSLPPEEFRAGMAEVIKHSVIGDADLFEELKQLRGPEDLTPGIVERALQVKVQIVERDPFEDNLRAHLNLGHTFGQAVERLAKYRMRHGYAVAMGLATAARLAVHLEYCAPTVCNEILGLLEQYQLPTRLPHEFTPAQILDAMGTDKKIQNKKLRLVLPRAIGHVEIAENVAPEEILRALNESY